MAKVITIATVTLALVACSGRGSDDAGTLEHGLRQPLSRVYGPIDSVECEKSDDRTVPHGGAAYDCTLHLHGGGARIVCAGLTRGVPLFERKPCSQSRFPRG